jgi:hypothetical protein
VAGVAKNKKHQQTKTSFPRIPLKGVAGVAKIKN